MCAGTRAVEKGHDGAAPEGVLFETTRGEAVPLSPNGDGHIVTAMQVRICGNCIQFMYRWGRLRDISGR